MKGDRSRPTVFVLLAKEAAKNPLLRMYVSGLEPVANVLIGCTDPDAARAAFPHAVCVGLTGSTVMERLRRLYRSLRGPSTANRHDGGVPAQGVSSPQSVMQSPMPYLRSAFAEALSTSLTLRRLPRPNLIIAVDGDVLVLARLLGAWWRVPYVYCMYEVFPNQFLTTGRAESRAMALIEAWGARGAVKTLVMDPTWASLVARRYHIPRPRFEVIRVCPPLPIAYSPPTTGAPRTVYYHGAYVPGRGLEPLILAMQHVKGAELHMRGVGDLEKSLKQLVTASNLEGKVIFHPAIDLRDLAAAAAAFDIGVSIACPTTANGRFLLGFKTMENLAAGLALLATDSRPLTAFLAEHDVGLVFRGCESRSIADAIQYCVDHPQRVSEWKARARSLAESQFNDQVQGARLRQTLAPWLDR